ATLDETFADVEVDWQVAIDGLNYADNPSHEANMPNFNEADLRSDAFFTLYESTEGLDIDAQLEILRTDLQSIFEGGTFTPEPTPGS
ncbi:MAG: hypothetical protein H7Y43_04090, partial [Akkermansiaceae bacterium]|nr:hypothetical protein [Verrucomicrobiales bacterium]